MDICGRTAVILDKYPIWLDGMERVLRELEFEPVGKTTNAGQALDLVKRHSPSLFLLDIDTNGSEPDGLTCLKVKLRGPLLGTASALRGVGPVRRMGFALPPGVP